MIYFQTLGYPLRIYKTSMDSKTQRFCQFCCKGFPNLKSLKEHMSDIHTENGKYKCHICKTSTFESYTGLKNHYAIHNGNKNQCTLCDATLHSPSNLIRHIKGVHGDDKKLSCTICNKKLKGNGALKTHMNTHGGIKYECNICHNFLSSKSKLTRHMNIHKPDEERFLKCQICGKMLATKSSLQSHISTIHNKVQHDCPKCNAKFSLMSNLRRHLRTVHVGSKRITCQICDTTMQKDSFVSHMKTIQMLVQNMSVMCAINFINQSHLYKYIKENLILSTNKTIGAKYVENN